MAHENAMTVLTDDDNEFAYAFLADRESYHNHKENSAYAVFLVEASLFGALLTTNAYGNFIENLPNANGAFLMFVIFIWALLHVFMRWQLRNRRIAALQVAILISALLDNLDGRELVIQKTEETRNSPMDSWLDYVIPRPSSTTRSKVDIKDYPEWYRSRYLIVQSKGTGAVFAEIFPTYGSIIMLLASLGYVFTNWT